jgi:hypothetical protein
MAVVVPSTDVKNYAKYQEYQGVLAATTATTSTLHQEAAKRRLVEVTAELIVSLMHSGKLSPANLLAAGTYGT